MAPGFDESSRRAEAVEFAPPSWNVCLSATLLGNRDVDWLAHLHEKRASIFMSPAYLAEMDTLFRRETDIDAMMAGAQDADALSDRARAALADMLAPFMAIRQRACIGESTERGRGRASYPPFTIHPRPASLRLSKRQKRVMDEIIGLAAQLAPGRRLASVTTSRFGNRAERRHNQNSLYARNLLNVLRVNSAQALWEMQHGAIGKALRRFEEQQTRKREAPADPAQFELFEALAKVETAPQAPICDQLVALIGRPDIQGLDARRYAAAQTVQRRHDRVVFLAERIDTLEIFAAQLHRIRAAGDDHMHYVATSDAGQSGEAGRRARRDIVGNGDPGFETIRQGHMIEDYFRAGAVRTEGARASVFLTYQMAEGINLQSADALVLLGVTSNLKDLLQGLGRIDRIDSPHAQIHYHLIDVPVAAIASDEKVARRLENYRTLSGRERIEHAEEADGDTQAILDSVGAYLREPRTLRKRNLADLFRATRDRIDAERYAHVVASRPDGTWGADIAVMEAAQSFALLHLCGESGRRRTFSPPRLLVVEEDGTLLRNQVACAQRLKAGLEESMAQGVETRPPDAARVKAALTALAARLGEIREWQLAPERTDSLLQSLSAFLTDSDDGEAVPEGIAPDEALFGSLSLRGVEYLAETWARVLDPYWVEAKRRVRENFSQNAAQSYISIADMTERLQADETNRGRVLRLMRDALEEARELDQPATDAVARRVSVAFIALKPSMH